MSLIILFEENSLNNSESSILRDQGSRANSVTMNEIDNEEKSFNSFPIRKLK